MQQAVDFIKKQVVDQGARLEGEGDQRTLVLTVGSECAASAANRALLDQQLAGYGVTVRFELAPAAKREQSQFVDGAPGAAATGNTEQPLAQTAEPGQLWAGKME